MPLIFQEKPWNEYSPHFLFWEPFGVPIYPRELKFLFSERFFRVYNRECFVVFNQLMDKVLMYYENVPRLLLSQRHLIAPRGVVGY